MLAGVWLGLYWVLFSFLRSLHYRLAKFKTSNCSLVKAQFQFSSVPKKRSKPKLHNAKNNNVRTEKNHVTKKNHASHLGSQSPSGSQSQHAFSHLRGLTVWSTTSDTILYLMNNENRVRTSSIVSVAACVQSPLDWIEGIAACGLSGFSSLTFFVCHSPSFKYVTDLLLPKPWTWPGLRESSRGPGMASCFGFRVGCFVNDLGFCLVFCTGGSICLDLLCSAVCLAALRLA